MSYNRYRKRDKSEINRKSEIGLGRVENYDSADISENVIHHVRDYLYTPLYLDIDGDYKGSYRIMKFLESGHTMFITSLCKASGTGREVYDTICGSLVYDKPTDETDISSCPINFRLLGNYDTSPILINATITVTVYREKSGTDGSLQIVTYIGIGMDGLSPYGKHGIRSIGTNLHDYTLGAVDYVDDTNVYDDATNPGSGFLAQWVFKVSDQIKRDLLAVPLYSEVLGSYVYAADNDSFQSGVVDTATINGVPFCGVYGLTIDGQDARHITVPAKHRGSSKEEAGEHQWEVLKSYPYLKYSRSGTKYQTLNDLSQENSLDDKGGLCYLSDFNDAEGQTMNDFLNSLGYWINDDTKEENLSVSSVITVGILRRFWNILKPLIDFSKLAERLNALEEWQKDINNRVIPVINNNLETLQGNINTLNDGSGGGSGGGSDDIDQIDTGDNPVIPDQPSTEPTEEEVYVDLNLSVGKLKFTSPEQPGEITTDNPIGAKITIPTARIRQKMSDGSVKNIGYTSALKYSWEYNDASLLISYGATTLSDSDYKDVGELNGTGAISISIKNKIEAPSFTSRELKFYTKDSNGHIAQAIVYVTFTNENVTAHGAVIGTVLNDIVIEDGQLIAPYYSIGDTVYFSVRYEEYITENQGIHISVNQATSVNGYISKEDRYQITAKSVSTTSTQMTGIYENVSVHPQQYKGQDIWDVEIYQLPDPNVEGGYSITYDLFYDNGRKFFMKLIIDFQPQDSYLELDRYSLYFGPNDPTVQRVIVSSNSSVSVRNSYSSWLTCKKVANLTYDISVLAWENTSNGRTGSLEFINEAGRSATLKVSQGKADKYIWVRPPSSYSSVEYRSNYITPGSSWSTTYYSPDAIKFGFSVESNISFDIYLDGKYKKSYSSTSGSFSSISVDIPENQTTETVTHTIEVRSELETITLVVTLLGQDPKPVIDWPRDNVFHKENAFDILRTEKIFTITCDHPEKISLGSSDDDLVAKIYYRSSDTVYVHCYPRTVDVWSSDKNITLSVSYDGQKIGSCEFVIEKTTSTVGTYFNVSSTIESFRKSDTGSQTIDITAFSTSGNLTLTTTDKRSSVLQISDKETITNGGGHYFNKWVVTIPKGLAPAPKTPWTLTLTNTCTAGTFVKYISIYEESDVAWSEDSSDFQLTAFGHLCIADGCEIMPIIYERRYMNSYIGTTFDPKSGSGPNSTFSVIRIVHDLSRLSISDNHNNYWAIKNGKRWPLLAYDTGNKYEIVGEGHNAITAFLRGMLGQCTFSNSLDTNFYNELGLEYVSTYGSEYIYSDIRHSSRNSNYVLLPSSKVTINPVNVPVSNPTKYLTNNFAPNFIPTPPDWKISTTLPSGVAASHDGYLSLNDMGENYTNQSFEYSVDSTTNWGDTGTYRLRHDGRYIMDFMRSNITVIDEIQGAEPDHGQEEPTGAGTIIYDQQDQLNNNLLVWKWISSGRDFMSCVQNDNPYQPRGSRCYFNSTNGLVTGSIVNSSLPETGGVPNGANVVTDLNLTLNCANLGVGFGGTSTFPGSYSKKLFDDAKIYDLENSKIWDSQDTFSGWNNMHAKNRRATLLTTSGIGTIPSSVRSSRGIILYFGIAGICEALDNSKASLLMYVPYVKVEAATSYSSIVKTTNYFLVKYGQRFGLGFSGVDYNVTQALVECSYQLTRTIVNSNMGYYKYNVKISSDSGVTYGSDRMNLAANGIPNLLLDEPTGMYNYTTNGTLDFEITHEDMCNIISYHIAANNLGITSDAAVENGDAPWYFYGRVSGLSGEQIFGIQPFSWLRDLKVTIK